MWTKPGSDPIHESAKCDAVVPIGREICDFLVRDLGVDPSQECIFGRQVLT